MKLSYFGYNILSKDNNNHDIYLFNIHPFLKCYCKYDNTTYKNKFKSKTEENLYLFHKTDDIFLFVMTKNHEIIKTINTASIDIDEIYNKLNNNEQLGFASYIYIQNNYYGIASTMLGPKNRSFVDFINDIFKSLGLNKYEFCSNAMMHQSSKSDVLNMPFIGKTIIEVGCQSPLYKYIRGFAGLDENEIRSFEIIIKPSRSTSIKDSFRKISSKLTDDGILKYIAKAKENDKEALEDFYIACMGGVSDSITSRDDGKIFAEIIRKSKSNTTLAIKLKELENDQKYNKDDIHDITVFCQCGAWTDYLSVV